MDQGKVAEDDQQDPKNHGDTIYFSVPDFFQFIFDQFFHDSFLSRSFWQLRELFHIKCFQIRSTFSQGVYAKISFHKV